MADKRGETWRFEVSCPHAERIFLVKESHGGKSWLPMTPKSQGSWTIDDWLLPGRYRMTYFIAEGTTYFNGGSFGLVGTRVGPSDPDVFVEYLGQPLPA